MPIKSLAIPPRTSKPKPATATPKGSLTIDLATAELVRRVQRADGLDLTTMVDRMLEAYVRQVHPDWQVVTDDSPPAAETVRYRGVFGGAERATVPERRALERRDPHSKGTLKPLPGGADRRKRQRRVKK